MNGSRGDRILELCLYVLGLFLFFAYFFISLSKWNDYYLFYLFCGCLFYLSLFRVVSKRKRKKVDYIIPFLCLVVSIPGGYAFDYLIKGVIRILLGLDFQLALLFSIGLFFQLVTVISTIFVVFGLMFWEELFFKRK